MRSLITACCLIFSLICNAQDKDKATILSILDKQTQAWNHGDLVSFMNGYWKNDSLCFIGKSGVTYGWQNTLNNYKKGYPDTAAMGKLKFDILSVKRLSPEYYHIIGKWMLQRSAGDLSGHYTLVFRKINGEWLIISDHSS
jgi:ketosteroid isomerase-like protein